MFFEGIMDLSDYVELTIIQRSRIFLARRHDVSLSHYSLALSRDGRQQLWPKHVLIVSTMCLPCLTYADTGTIEGCLTSSTFRKYLSLFPNL